MIGSVDAPHTMSYLPDIAAGLLTLAERDTAVGRAWHLPAAEPPTIRQFADVVAAEIERPVRLRASGPPEPLATAEPSTPTLPQRDLRPWPDPITRRILGPMTHDHNDVGAYGRTRLRRSRQDRVLGGVCAGISEQLDVDPLRRPRPVSVPDTDTTRQERSRIAAVDAAMTSLGDRLRDPDVRAGARRSAAGLSTAVGAGVGALASRARGQAPPSPEAGAHGPAARGDVPDEVPPPWSSI